MSKYTILTTSMRKIIVSSSSEEEAMRVAESQYDEWEVLMMISRNINS